MGATRRPSIGEATTDVAFIGDHQPPDAKKFWTEARLFMELAVPTTLLGFGFTISPLLTASYVGLRFGPVFLSAFTLGNLTGNLSTFSLLAGIFSAADTLAPQAFGVGNYREVGLIAIRGVFASFVVVVPINILLFLYIEDALIAVGQDPEAAVHATEWYRIFLWALPFSVLYDAAWKFLSAQHIMRPLIYVSVFCCVVVLPIALEFCTRYFGFLGSAMAYVCFQVSQTILLLVYLVVKKPHTPGTWPGLGCWREALKYTPMMEFLHLGIGGILSQSEWIYWEALGLMIGSLGVVPLSAHTIPNQVIMTLCMIPFSFGTALAIRMGHVLSKSVEHAKHIAAGATLVSTVTFALISFVVYIKADWIFAIFTTDEEVLALAHSIWWKVCFFNLNIAIFGLLWGVATGLGMQWTLGGVNFFFLWIFGVPVTYYFALKQGGGLNAAWTWINAPYSLMNCSLVVIFVFADWGKVQTKIREREAANTKTGLHGIEEMNGTSGEKQNLLDDGRSPGGYGVHSC